MSRDSGAGPAGLLRLGLRTSGFVASTLAHWACLDINRFGHQEDERSRGDLASRQLEEITFKWEIRWARQLCHLYGVNVAAVGHHVDRGLPYPGVDERGIGRVFIMNHRSMMDVAIGLSHCAGHFVSRADLAGWPLIGHVARTTGTLFVDRASKESGATVMQKMIECLQEGSGITLFPEGTAFLGDEVRPFRVGAFKAALHADAEIVPIGLAYADQTTAYGDESFLEHMKRVAAMKRIDVGMEIGAPIRCEGRTVSELRDHAHTVVQALVHRARSRVG